MRIHGIRDKTFPSPVPQPKKNYKNGTLTKNRSRDEELAFAQTTSSLLLKSALRFYFFYSRFTVTSTALSLIP